jgi:hypothetical protein
MGWQRVRTSFGELEMFVQDGQRVLMSEETDGSITAKLDGDASPDRPVLVREGDGCGGTIGRIEQPYGTLSMKPITVSPGDPQRLRAYAR